MRTRNPDPLALYRPTITLTSLRTTTGHKRHLSFDAEGGTFCGLWTDLHYSDEGPLCKNCVLEARNVAALLDHVLEGGA